MRIKKKCDEISRKYNQTYIIFEGTFRSIYDVAFHMSEYFVKSIKLSRIQSDTYKINQKMSHK